MNIVKQRLRKELSHLRLELSTEEVTSTSRTIAEKLLSVIDLRKTKLLHIYTPVPGWQEIDTEPIKEGISKSWPNIRIVSAPPRKSQSIPIEKFDTIIVPVLGFDRELYRLGYGGGWYDRFLANQQQANKIGLAYSFCQVEDLPHESHDIPLQQIVTEVGIIS